jgi:hypothetical protein
MPVQAQSLAAVVEPATRNPSANPAITASGSAQDPFRYFPPVTTVARGPETNPVRTLGALLGFNTYDAGPPSPPSAPGHGVVPKQPLPPEFKLPPPRVPDWQRPGFGLPYVSLVQGGNGGSTGPTQSQPTPRLGYEPKVPPPVFRLGAGRCGGDRSRTTGSLIQIGSPSGLGDRARWQAQFCLA